MEIKMLVKSLIFMGRVTSDTDVSMTVTMANQIVFNGTVVAVDNKSSSTLFQTEIPINCLNIVPMTVAVSSGTIIMDQILINQTLVSNERYSFFQLALLQHANWEETIDIMLTVADPPFSQSELNLLRSQNPEDRDKQTQLINAHQCALEMPDPDVWGIIPINDPRENVRLNGILQIPQRRPGQDGTWHWTVESGNILSYDLILA